MSYLFKFCLDIFMKCVNSSTVRVQTPACRQRKFIRMKSNKRHMGLDALHTKVLHKHNFHNFGRAPPQDASHTFLTSIRPGTSEEIAFENGAEKLKKKLQKMLNQHNFHNLTRDLPRMPDAKFEVNWSTNFRGDSV